jgi:DNA-binding LacI/PurR family transcriptional regulator
VSKQATSADVARIAGVSRATVSYVLNDRQDVKITEAVRHRVRAVAREVGYQPSPAARALQAGRGDVVLLLVPDWETTGEIGRCLGELGRLISAQGLACLRYEGAHWQEELGRLLTMVTAAAVVTFEPLMAADAKALANAGVPEVRAFLLDQPGGSHTTLIDQADVVAAQVGHLRTRGYSSLAYLATKHPRNEPFQEARITAFRAICAELDMPASVAVVQDDVAAVTTTIREWLQRTPARLGICAWNDDAAIAVLTSSSRLGVDVPARLGVIGCDDTLTARLVDPPLSSVRFDLTQEAGNVARQLAFSLGLDGGEASAASQAAVAAVPRAST